MKTTKVILKNLIAKRDALNAKIAAVRRGRMAVGVTLKIKGTAKLPDGIVNREMNYKERRYDGAFIPFTITKRAGNILYVKDTTGWNDFKRFAVHVKHTFGVKA